MARKAEAIASYDFSHSDELLLDANIWLLVYGPQIPRDPRVAIYSQALDKILAAKSRPGCFRIHQHLRQIKMEPPCRAKPWLQAIP